MTSSLKKLSRYFKISILCVLLQTGVLVLLSNSDPNPQLTYHSVIFPPQWEKSAPSFEGWIGRYRRLNNWDSFHFLSITQFGYTRSTTFPPKAQAIHSYQDNEAFFPAYPLLSRVLSKCFQISPDLSLLITAQIMAALAWTYFLLILNDVGVSFQKSQWALFWLSSSLPLFTWWSDILNQSLFLESLE